LAHASPDIALSLPALASLLGLLLLAAVGGGALLSIPPTAAPESANATTPLPAYYKTPNVDFVIEWPMLSDLWTRPLAVRLARIALPLAGLFGALAVLAHSHLSAGGRRALVEPPPPDMHSSGGAARARLVRVAHRMFRWMAARLAAPPHNHNTRSHPSWTAACSSSASPPAVYPGAASGEGGGEGDGGGDGGGRGGGGDGRSGEGGGEGGGGDGGEGGGGARSSAASSCTAAARGRLHVDPGLVRLNTLPPIDPGLVPLSSLLLVDPGLVRLNLLLHRLGYISALGICLAGFFSECEAWPLHNAGAALFFCGYGSFATLDTLLRLVQGQPPFTPPFTASFTPNFSPPYAASFTAPFTPQFRGSGAHAQDGTRASVVRVSGGGATLAAAALALYLTLLAYFGLQACRNWARYGPLRYTPPAGALGFLRDGTSNWPAAHPPCGPHVPGAAWLEWALFLPLAAHCLCLNFGYPDAARVYFGVVLLAEEGEAERSGTPEDDDDMLTPTGYPPPTQQPTRPTAHTAHSQQGEGRGAAAGRLGYGRGAPVLVSRQTLPAPNVTSRSRKSAARALFAWLAALFGLGGGAYPLPSPRQCPPLV